MQGGTGEARPARLSSEPGSSTAHQGARTCNLRWAHWGQARGQCARLQLMHTPEPLLCPAPRSACPGPAAPGTPVRSTSPREAEGSRGACTGVAQGPAWPAGLAARLPSSPSTPCPPRDLGLACQHCPWASCDWARLGLGASGFLGSRNLCTGGDLGSLAVGSWHQVVWSILDGSQGQRLGSGTACVWAGSVGAGGLGLCWWCAVLGQLPRKDFGDLF